MAQGTGTVADSIRRRLGECSPAERKVARALLAAYPSAGFETVARLAERAGVSGPTVVRFTTRLGYRGFPDFQQALRDELESADRRDTRDGWEIRTAVTDPPTDRSDGAATDPGGRDDSVPVTATTLLAQAAEVASDALRRTFSGLPPYDLQGAIGLLADRTRRLHLAGAGHGHLLASYLGQLLGPLRDGVHLVAHPPVERAAAVAELSGKDVLVVFDFGPYDGALSVLARHAARSRAKIVLFTDVGLSPIAAHAEVVLPSATGAASGQNGLAPAVAVTETVVAGVLDMLGPASRTRQRLAAALVEEISTA